jgi:hypothetical protein
VNRRDGIAVVSPYLDGWVMDPDALAGNIVDALIAAGGLPDATFRVRKDAPATSKAISSKVATGTQQAEALALIKRHNGLTDDELEIHMKRAHQSVSATRNTLMRKGVITDSGLRRKTRYGNDAIVWVAT